MYPEHNTTVGIGILHTKFNNILKLSELIWRHFSTPFLLNITSVRIGIGCTAARLHLDIRTQIVLATTEDIDSNALGESGVKKC
jgi:hypothetical protein